MITPSHLIEYFARNVTIIKMQTAGLTHAESLLQLPFRANCMNWVAGHLVANRLAVLKLLGAEQPETAALLERYNRESEPITADGEGVLPLERLLELLEATQALLAERLAAQDPAAFDQEVAFYGRRSMPVGQWLLFFFFHDSYHTGQAEILRQAAGKDDKII